MSFIKDIGMDKENRPKANKKNVHDITSFEIMDIFSESTDGIVLNIDTFLGNLESRGFKIIKKEREND